MQTRSETLAAPGAQHAYAFLSHPPSHDPYTVPDPNMPQSRYTRRRSLAAISNWASNVQPGAPAPISPGTATKFADSASSSARPADIRTMRRHSVKPTPPPPVEYLPDSPSSSDQSSPSPVAKPDFKTDPGYTSVYVTLPNTPTTEQPTTSSGPSTSRGKGLDRFKTFSLKPSARSKTVPEPRPKEKEREKEKKSKYAEARPAQLATDLALAQLLGGGTIEHHMRQAAENEAKRNGARKTNGQVAGVGQPWRDEEGRVWRDEQEQWEYRGLLRDRHGRRQSEAEGDSSPTSSVENYHDRPRAQRDGKTKRRPEPLDLAPSRPHGSSRAYSVDEGRREFAHPAAVVPAEPSGKRSALKPMFNMFKSSGGRK